MKTVAEIQDYLDNGVNKLLAQHGGRVDIIDIDSSNIAKVMLSGGCHGCPGARYTLKMIIKNAIAEYEPGIVDVEDVTDHSQGLNPYYKKEE